MTEALVLRLHGVHRAETARALVERLVDAGCRAAAIDEAAAAALGGAAAADAACANYRAHGILTVVAYDSSDSVPSAHFHMGALEDLPIGIGGYSPLDLEVELDVHDTPDFAADKLFDMLVARGVVRVEVSEYTPQEEALVRKRLADLGYLE